MSYQVLARKYRPQTFEEVVGQAPIVTTLQNAVAQNRIHHAYLFSGLRGVGKTTVARLLAKALNCEKGPAPRPCNACSSCAEIASSRSLDVLEIDGASNRGIDAVRELRETVRYAPSRDRYKIYIIDEVHMLTSEAWNALLKTLEEPPPQVVFVFATTEYRRIPLTILSRCQHFEFRKIPQAELAAHLRKVSEGEKVSVPESVLELIARMAEGSLRDGQSALDQVIAFSGAEVTEEQARTILGVIDRDLITGFFRGVRLSDCVGLVAIVETVFDRGYPPVQYLEDLMAYGRDLLLARVLPDPAKQIAGSLEDVEALVEQAAAFTEDELLRLLELLTREEPRLKHSAHPRYLLEAMAIKMARLADLKPIEDLIARLEAAPEGPQDAPPAPGPGTGRARLAPMPPPRAPSLPEAATVGTPRDLSDVEAILKRVQEERAALGGFLGHARWVEIVEGTLRIAFHEKHGFFREKVESRESIDFLRRVAREVVGRDVAIKVTIAAPALADSPAAGTGVAPQAEIAAGRAADGAPAESEAARKERLKSEAMRQPVVRTLLDAFGGEIVDVDSA